MFKSTRIPVLLTSLLLLAIPIIAGGCSWITGEEADTAAPQVFDITAQKALSLIEENEGNPDFMILDVRLTEEYEEGHVEGAINIDYYAADFESRLRKLDKKKTYLIYCLSGIRSASARDTMAELGFKNIYNMSGGIRDWQTLGYPVVR